MLSSRPGAPARSVSVVGRSHRRRALPRAALLVLPSQANHKEHDPLARRGQSRPYQEGSGTGKRFPEFIWRTDVQPLACVPHLVLAHHHPAPTIWDQASPPAPNLAAFSPAGRIRAGCPHSSSCGGKGRGGHPAPALPPPSHRPPTPTCCETPRADQVTRDSGRATAFYLLKRPKKKKKKRGQTRFHPRACVAKQNLAPSVYL